MTSTPSTPTSPTTPSGLHRFGEPIQSRLSARPQPDAPGALPDPDPKATSQLDMPAPPEQAATDIARAGVEGRPADAKAGPGWLRLELLAIAAGLILVSAVVGMWLGWGVGLVMLVVGTLALVLNPVMGATAMRAKDRQQAADEELGRPNSHAHDSR